MDGTAVEGFIPPAATVLVLFDAAAVVLVEFDVRVELPDADAEAEAEADAVDEVSRPTVVKNCSPWLLLLLWVDVDYAEGD